MLVTCDCTRHLDGLRNLLSSLNLNGMLQGEIDKFSPKKNTIDKTIYLLLLNNNSLLRNLDSASFHDRFWDSDLSLLKDGFRNVNLLINLDSFVNIDGFRNLNR